MILQIFTSLNFLSGYVSKYLSSSVKYVKNDFLSVNIHPMLIPALCWQSRKINLSDRRALAVCYVRELCCNCFTLSSVKYLPTFYQSRFRCVTIEFPKMFRRLLHVTEYFRTRSDDSRRSPNKSRYTITSWCPVPHCREYFGWDYFE